LCALIAFVVLKQQIITNVTKTLIVIILCLGYLARL
jgi:hypothetical protein